MKKIRAGFCYVKKKRKRSEVKEQGEADMPEGNTRRNGHELLHNPYNNFMVRIGNRLYAHKARLDKWLNNQVLE